MAVESKSRREFLQKTLQGSALTATAALGWFYLIQQQAHASPHAVRPPGAEARDDFYARALYQVRPVRAGLSLRHPCSGQRRFLRANWYALFRAARNAVLPVRGHPLSGSLSHWCD